MITTGFTVMLLAVGAGVGSGQLGTLLGFVGILVGASLVGVRGVGGIPRSPAALARLGARHTAFLRRNLAGAGLAMAWIAVTAVAGEVGPVLLCLTMLVLFLLGLCLINTAVLLGD
jgi:hypothetical protein